MERRTLTADPSFGVMSVLPFAPGPGSLDAHVDQETDARRIEVEMNADVAVWIKRREGPIDCSRQKGRETECTGTS